MHQVPTYFDKKSDFCNPGCTKLQQRVLSTNNPNYPNPMDTVSLTLNLVSRSPKSPNNPPQRWGKQNWTKHDNIRHAWDASLVAITISLIGMLETHPWWRGVLCNDHGPVCTRFFRNWWWTMNLGDRFWNTKDWHIGGTCGAAMLT